GIEPGPPGAGACALATGLVQVAWVLARVRERCPDQRLHLDWAPFAKEAGGLLVWEAFVSAEAKGASHVDDAGIAVQAFVDAGPDPSASSAIAAERPLSLAGAAALWSGWADDHDLLHRTPIVIRA
ncbi:MAG: hypothetical protein ACRDL0_07890, partial [Thermoleophilaceae bacterium]